jgi:hypothetical protein
MSGGVIATNRLRRRDRLCSCPTTNGMVIETGCQLGVQNDRRHGIASAQAICPSKLSDVAIAR